MSKLANSGHRKRLNHKAKLKLARKLQHKDERYTGLFQSGAWLERKWRISMRVAKREVVAKYYADARRRLEIMQTLPQVK